MINNYVAGSGNIEAIRAALRDCAVTGDVLELGCGNGTYSKILAETADEVKDGGLLIVASFCMEGISPFQKLGMIFRYLKTYGKPPNAAQKLTVSKTRTMVEQAGLTVLEARLVGISSKAIFVRAEREANERLSLTPR